MYKTRIFQQNFFDGTQFQIKCNALNKIFYLNKVKFNKINYLTRYKSRVAFKINESHARILRHTDTN